MFELLDVLKDVKTIGISGHIRPDGDCVGSCMAMYMYLRKMFPGKRVDIFLEKPAPVYDCISYLDEIKTDFQTDIVKYDAFFAIDCDSTRLGGAKELFEKAELTINIDHHLTNQGCGKLNYIDAAASSASELVFDLLQVENLDKEIALSLYLGIIHDCGVFQFSNTSPKTLQTAAKLIPFGFDFPKIIEETFYEKTYLQTQIMGRALVDSERVLNDRCIFSVVSAKEMEFYGITSADLDGIVNQLRNIKGVDCAIFLYEIDFQQYKVSMRSNEKVNVAQVAGLFGGGGHARAAGCTLSGTYYDVVNNLLLPISEQLA